MKQITEKINIFILLSIIPVIYQYLIYIWTATINQMSVTDQDLQAQQDNYDAQDVTIQANNKNQDIHLINQQDNRYLEDHENEEQGESPAFPEAAVMGDGSRGEEEDVKDETSDQAPEPNRLLGGAGEKASPSHLLNKDITGYDNNDPHTEPGYNGDRPGKMSESESRPESQAEHLEHDRPAQRFAPPPLKLKVASTEVQALNGQPQGSYTPYTRGAASASPIPIFPQNASARSQSENNREQDLEIFRIVFEAFDGDRAGYINKEDALAIAVSMRKDFTLVQETLNRLLQNTGQPHFEQGDQDALDFAEAGYHQQSPQLVSFGHFATLLWEVEERQNSMTQRMDSGYDDILGHTLGALSPGFHSQYKETSPGHSSSALETKKKYSIAKKTRRNQHQDKGLINLQTIEINETSALNSLGKLDRLDSRELRRLGQAQGTGDGSLNQEGRAQNEGKQSPGAKGAEPEASGGPQSNSNDLYRVKPALVGKPERLTNTVSRTDSPLLKSLKGTLAEKNKDIYSGKLILRVNQMDIHESSESGSGSPPQPELGTSPAIRKERGEKDVKTQDQGDSQVRKTPNNTDQRLDERGFGRIDPTDLAAVKRRSTVVAAPKPALGGQKHPPGLSRRERTLSSKPRNQKDGSQGRMTMVTSGGEAGEESSMLRRGGASPDREDGRAMNRSQFMKALKENQEKAPPPTVKHPLELESKQSSLTKLQKAGFSMPLAAVIPELRAQGTVGSPLAKFLRKEYGEMIPKANLTSLPDFKITEFIRILSEYHKKMESYQNYIDAKRARGKVRELAQVELLRQVKILHHQHGTQLKELEAQQTQDCQDFQAEWEVYLIEEEGLALEQIRKLKADQEVELDSRRHKVLNQYHKFVYSKQYCTLRAQERRHFAVREYVQADKCRREADAVEVIEKQRHQEHVKVEAEKAVEKLKKLHVFQKESLMKRIRRDRDEQLLQRGKDVRKMVKRNKLELSELVEKQQMESRTLTQFLRYSLGKRAPKDSDKPATLPATQGDEWESTTDRQAMKESFADGSNHLQPSGGQEPLVLKNIFSHLKSPLPEESGPVAQSQRTRQLDERSRHQKAFIPDRRPTIHELASSTFMGVREQRPAEMLKAELQAYAQSRASFYRPAPAAYEGAGISKEEGSEFPRPKLQLPKIREINQFLKMKYHHRKELNNTSPNESKAPPFMANMGEHSEIVKQLQPLQASHPSQARRLKKYNVTSGLFALSDSFSTHFEPAKNYQVNQYKCGVSEQFYYGSKKGYYKKLRELHGPLLGTVNNTARALSSLEQSDQSWNPGSQFTDAIDEQRTENWFNGEEIKNFQRSRQPRMYNTLAMTMFDKRHASANAAAADPQSGKAISILTRNTDQAMIPQQKMKFSQQNPNRFRITSKRLSALVDPSQNLNSHDDDDGNQRLNTTQNFPKTKYDSYGAASTTAPSNMNNAPTNTTGEVLTGQSVEISSRKKKADGTRMMKATVSTGRTSAVEGQNTSGAPSRITEPTKQKQGFRVKRAPINQRSPNITNTKYNLNQDYIAQKSRNRERGALTVQEIRPTEQSSTPEMLPETVDTTADNYNASSLPSRRRK